MREEQIKILEELRDEIPGFAPSTVQAMATYLAEMEKEK